MSDEFDVFHANHEESQEIIDWAVATGAAVWMLHEMMNMDYPSKEELIADVHETIDLILGNVPEIMVNPIKAAAFTAIEESQAEEAAVEEFREELKDL